MLADDDYSHSYTSSTSNQKIESYWTNFRKHCSEHYIETFTDLADSGGFCYGNCLHIGLLRYVFLPIISLKLKECAEHWNNHIIRYNSSSCLPYGKPDEIYFSSTAETTGIQVTDNQLQQSLASFPQLPPNQHSITGIPQLDEYLTYLTSTLNLPIPKSTNEAIFHYLQLKYHADI